MIHSFGRAIRIAYLLAAIVAVFCVSSLLPGPSLAESLRPGVDPIDGIERTRNVSELGTRLSKRIPPAGASLLVFGRPDRIIRSLLPLWRSDRMKATVFVLPEEGKLTPDSTKWFLHAMEKEGVPESDRALFRFDNGVVTGKAGGAAVSFIPVSELRPRDKEEILLVDTRFIYGLFRNEVATPYVELGSRLMATLREQHVVASSVLIFDPVDSDDYPLDAGVIPGMLSDMFKSPAQFQDRLPEKWERFADAEAARYFQQHAEAFAQYKAYLESNPADASVLYRVARMGAIDGAVDFSIEWMGRAAAADPVYRKGFAELGEFLYRKGEPEQAVRALEAGLMRFPGDPIIGTGLSELRFTQGARALVDGDTAAAEKSFRASAEVPGARPDIVKKAREALRSMKEAP